MGFFDKLKGGLKLNTIAKAIGAVIDLLDLYEVTGKISLLHKAAWLCRIGIIDIEEKYKFSLTAPIFVPIGGHQERMILNEAMFHSVGHLSMKCQDLTLVDQEYIQAIIEKEKAFYDVDKQISYNEKKKFI